MLKWIGAFGEGLAMLAAAGGPEIHPHRFSPADERARWDRDVADFNRNAADVERFFLDIRHKELAGNQINEKAFSFYGIQGPWHTVGWKMSVVIEDSFGRARLIDVYCDQRKLLATYNLAAADFNTRNTKIFRVWSPELTKQLR